ncbi:MAG: hypothetical protein U0793_04755 [Gemmataceae bacterium]
MLELTEAQAKALEADKLAHREPAHAASIRSDPQGHVRSHLHDRW